MFISPIWALPLIWNRRIGLVEGLILTTACSRADKEKQEYRRIGHFVGETDSDLTWMDYVSTVEAVLI